MSILVQNTLPPNITAMQAAAANKASQEQVGRFLGLKSAEKGKTPRFAKEPPASVGQQAASGGAAKQSAVSQNGRSQQQGGDLKAANQRIARDDREASAYTRIEASHAETEERLRGSEDRQETLNTLLESQDGGISIDLAHVQEEALESALHKDHDEYIGELDLLALRRVLKRAESMTKPDKLQFYLELLRSMPTQMTELRGVLHSLVTGSLSTFK